MLNLIRNIIELFFYFLVFKKCFNSDNLDVKIFMLLLLWMFFKFKFVYFIFDNEMFWFIIF